MLNDELLNNTHKMHDMYTLKTFSLLLLLLIQYDLYEQWTTRQAIRTLQGWVESWKLEFENEFPWKYKMNIVWKKNFFLSLLSIIYFDSWFILWYRKQPIIQ